MQCALRNRPRPAKAATSAWRIHDPRWRLYHETHGKALRLIAVTGWKQGSDRVLAKIAGFNHHIGKPYDPRALIELLAKATREDS